MNQRQYVEAAIRGDIKVGGRVPIDDQFIDTRGRITNLVIGDVGSVSSITSIAGAVRANHYHRTDWHFTLVVSGVVRYCERAVGSYGDPDVELTVLPGDMFWTPPLREHAMLFLQDSLIITASRRNRDHESHEEDVVRVPDFMSNDRLTRYRTSALGEYGVSLELLTQ